MRHSRTSSGKRTRPGCEGSSVRYTWLLGDGILQGAAIDAARRWRFRPTIVEGKPGKVTGLIQFNFTL